LTTYGVNNELLIHEIAELAQNLGILNERAYRDLCIRIEFEKLHNSGAKVEDIEYELAEQFSSKEIKITPESIHRIVYSGGRK